MKDNVSELLYFFKKIKDEYDKKIEEAALEIALTKPEADLLLFLSNNPSYNTARDAVVYRGFSKAYVSKALNSLYKKNYISLKQDVVDKRYQHIFINENIINKVKILQNTQEKEFQEHTKNITEEEKKLFIEIINKMFKNKKGEKNV